ncbi:hypothetical protein MASR2M48_11670 [Spirochaetota bacterium]
MDILKVLAYNNDHTIREPVVSSVLNYVLSPVADHGLGSCVIVELVKALKGSCSFVDDQLVKRLQSFTYDKAVDVKVSSEWMPSMRHGVGGRRIDSLIVIRIDPKVYLLGIKVKIDEDSVQDTKQLEDYAAMLAMHAELVLEDLRLENEETKQEDVRTALIHLIPGSATKALDFAKLGSRVCNEKNVEGIIVLPWWPLARTASLEGLKVSDSSMDTVLQNVIEAVVQGKASPCDAQALDLVRSLRNAINHDFVFFPDRVQSSFIDGQEYEQGLCVSARQLLNEFRKAARDEGIKRPLAASPRRTCIGVPFASPPEGKGNSICRIETVESYATGLPRTSFVLQLSREKYLAGIGEIKEILDQLAVQVTVDDSPGQYYQNGKDNEEVIRLHFEDLDRELDLEEMVMVGGVFRGLITKLRRMFKE